MDIEKINDFKENGYIVIENVFNEYEINELRKNFHDYLKNYFNINHENILSGKDKNKHNIRKKSPVSKLFYSDWKLETLLNDKVYNLSYDLLKNTFLDNNLDGFKHKFESTDTILPFIDRMCYRLPDNINKEGGLKLHIDRNPKNPYCGKYFRPIQSFICLTNHYSNNDGGLQLVPGFHKEFDNYFKDVECQDSGDFFRMSAPKYASLNKRIETVYAPAGSIIFWDNRLPHKTADFLTTFDTREVIYFSYLPNVKLNFEYFKNQYKNLLDNIPPPAFNIKNFNNKNNSKDKNNLKYNNNDNSLPALNENIINLLEDRYILLNPSYYK
jgi:hypothetical protein